MVRSYHWLLNQKRRGFLFAVHWFRSPWETDEGVWITDISDIYQTWNQSHSHGMKHKTFNMKLKKHIYLSSVDYPWMTTDQWPVWPGPLTIEDPMHVRLFSGLTPSLASLVRFIWVIAVWTPSKWKVTPISLKATWNASIEVQRSTSTICCKGCVTMSYHSAWYNICIDSVTKFESVKRFYFGRYIYYVHR